MALLAAPLNSSHQCGVQVTAAVVVLATPVHCACECRAKQIAKRSANISNVDFIGAKLLQRCLLVNEIDVLVSVQFKFHAPKISD